MSRATTTPKKPNILLLFLQRGWIDGKPERVGGSTPSQPFRRVYGVMGEGLNRSPDDMKKQNKAKATINNFILWRKKDMTTFKKWFCGNEISSYGRENGFVDYATFSKAFDAVLANSLMSATGFENWEKVSGFVDNSEEIEALEQEREEMQSKLFSLILRDKDEDEEAEDTKATRAKIEEIDDQIEELQEAEYEEDEVYQWYIVDEQGARLCEEYGMILYYNEDLDLYLWGVTHFGTAWSYVLTNIPCEKE